MKAAASSGPPSPRGSSVSEPPSLPRGAGVRPRPVLVNKTIQCREMVKDTSCESATLGRTFQLFGYWFPPIPAPFNICRFDRVPLYTHVPCETADANLAE